MKKKSLEILIAVAARRRWISFAAAWIIGLVSLIVPDTTWVEIPSFVDWVLVAGAATSVILSFTLLVHNQELSTLQTLALMSSSLTATAAMVTFQSLPDVSPVRIMLLSVCTCWQFAATFMELRDLVERGRVNVPQKPN